MNLLKLAGKSLSDGGGGGVRIWGGGAIGRSSALTRLILGGTQFDYAEGAGKVYDNSVVLTCIQWKANAISECDLIVQQRTPKGWKRVDTVASRAAVSVINRPNEYYNGGSLLKGAVLSWDVRGQWFALKRRDRLNRMMGLYWIPHYQIVPSSDVNNAEGTKLITNYYYTPKGYGPMSYDPSEVIHVRNGIDPEDPRCGLSPLAAALRDVCTENEAANWLASILRNGGAPSVWITPKTGKDLPAPTPDQWGRLKDYVNEFIQDKRGEAATMPIPVEMIRPSFSPAELDLGAIREIPTSRICAAEGIDPMVVGLPSQSKTYSNLAEARDSAGKQTILPMLAEWADQLGFQVLPEFGLDPSQYRFRWDTSNVSWLQDETDSLHERLRKNWEAGAYDLARYKELLGESPLPADRGVTYFSLASSSIAASVSAPAKKVVSDVARRMVAAVGGRKTPTLRKATIIDESLQREHDALINRTQENLNALLKRYANKQLEAAGFIEEFGNILSESHAAAYRLGWRLSDGPVPDPVAFTDFGERAAALESPFVQGLINDLESGRYGEAVEVGSAGLQARLDLYSRKVSASASDGFVDGSETDSDWAWELGGTEDHCEDCPYIAASGPYTQDTLFTKPRAGDTPCLGNCLCRLVRNDGVAGFGPVAR
jgi:HK97 family phage portal protein